jgi:hypothetical protein
VKIASALVLLALFPAGSAAAVQPRTSPTSLNLIVLPARDLGAPASHLLVDLRSGTTSNARAADDSFDPDDDAAALARAGRIRGYTLVYSDPSSAAVFRGVGIVEVGTNVELFRSSVTASRYQGKSMRDLDRVRGRNLGGLTLVSWERFATPAPALSQRTVAARLSLRLGDRPIHTTFVNMRYGRLLGEAAITRSDGKNVNRQVIGLARILAARMRAAGAGTLQGRPVVVPRKQTGAALPTGSPDIAHAGLTLAQLPAGAVLLGEGFVPGQAVATYTRDAVFNNAAVQRTGLIAVRNEINLLRNEREAAGRLRLLGTILQAPNAGQTIAQELLAGSGQKPRSVRVEEHRALDIGDDAFGVSASFAVGSKRYAAALVYVRVGRVVTSVIVSGLGGRLPLQRVAALGQAAARNVSRAGVRGEKA